MRKKKGKHKINVQIEPWFGDWKLFILSPYTHARVHGQLLQPCPTFCEPVTWSPPGSSVHGILQERIMEWDAMLSSGGSSKSRSLTQSLMSPTLADRFLTTSATWEALFYTQKYLISSMYIMNNNTKYLSIWYYDI